MALNFTPENIARIISANGLDKRTDLCAGFAEFFYNGDERTETLYALLPDGSVVSHTHK